MDTYLVGVCSNIRLCIDVEFTTLILLHKDKITNELKNKLQTKTKEILKLEQVPDDKLTPAFDNSIKSLIGSGE